MNKKERKYVARLIELMRRDQSYINLLIDFSSGEPAGELKLIAVRILRLGHE